MRGLGTIINVAFILLGGLFGMLFGKRISARTQDLLLTATGVATLFIGGSGAMAKMLVLSDGVLSAEGSLMLIISLALGGVIGSALNIEALIECFGRWLREKSGSSGDKAFIDGFVTASCTVCIGAMAVVGSIEDGIYGNYSILLAKGVLDAIIVCILTASQGKGCIFSAVPVAVFQGAVTVLAVFAGSFMTAGMLDALSLVGSVLNFCVGLNLIRGEKISVANLLPSLVIAVIWGFAAD